MPSSSVTIILDLGFTGNRERTNCKPSGPIGLSVCPNTDISTVERGWACTTAWISATVGPSAASEREVNTPGSEPGPTDSPSARILPSNVTPAQTTVERRPGVSASRAILVLLTLLALAAFLVPLPMHRPAWIEAEAVVVVWWLVWAGALSWLLYTGVGLRDDFRVNGSDDNSGPWWRHMSHLDFGNLDVGGMDESGCVTMLVGIVLVGLLILVGWILLEVIFPLVIPLTYGVMLLLLTRVVHRHASCRGQLLKAMAFGAGWASLYTLPLVMGVAVVHLILG
jgi:hypothetical protein